MNELKEIFARESPSGWRLVLSNGKNASTRGRTFNFKVVWINISIGEDIEILRTLLHEITHTYLGGRHDDRFFKFMIQLDKKYGVSPNDIYRVEDYYPTALKEYQEEYGRS